MKILFGIVFFHLLVILRTKSTDDDLVPYLSVFFISLMTVVFVVIMMYVMEPPDT